MSLHLGNDFFISSKQLIAILNLQHLQSSSQLLKMLDSKRASNHLRMIGQRKYRSAIITQKGTCYLSPIDSKTLARRSIKETYT